MNPLLFFIFVGFFAGLIPASVNAFKDPPYEGFHVLRFPRSIFIGTIFGAVMYFLLVKRYIIADNLGFIFLSIYCMERLTGETVKGFFYRTIHEDYKEVYHLYRLPKAYLWRVLMGIGFFSLITIVFVISIAVIHNYRPTFIHNKILGIIVGLTSGLLVASGGGAKDSPSEGFEKDKFLRSPIVGAIGGIFLITLTATPDVLLLACVGFDRVILEGYKTFLSGKPRGIFDKKKVAFPRWLHYRWLFLGTYLFSVIFLFLSLYLIKIPLL